MTEQAIPVVTVDWTAAEGEKGIFGRTQGAVARVSEVASGVLAENVASVCRYLGEVFEQASAAAGEFELRSLQVQVDISAKGEVRLVGAASAEIRGGLTLVFERRDRR